MPRVRSAAALPLLCTVLATLAACGGSVDANERYAAGVEKLGRGDHLAAVADLEVARDAIGEDRDHPDYWGVRLALAEAHATDRPHDAQRIVLQTAAERPESLAAAEYAYFGGRLDESGHTLEALDVVHAGLKVHADDPQLAGMIAVFRKQAEEDDELKQKLRGLGYLN